jgi:adenylyl- and sulfurtransferase ThiI
MKKFAKKINTKRIAIKFPEYGTLIPQKKTPWMRRKVR